MTFESDAACVLVLNAGSSSLKFALFRIGNDIAPILSGNVERIGHANAALRITHAERGRDVEPSSSLHIPDHAAAVPLLLKELPQTGVRIVSVGHRVVHGGSRYSDPQLIDEEVLAELTRCRALSPEHMPAALSVLEALRSAYPEVPHIACFDTAFHRELPREAALLPIPRRYFELGVRRYGFHGLSYSYLLEELARVAGVEAASGRIVLAHLGSGASLAAVRDGRCIDTTMALTPAAGLVMSTRSGDLDPGLYDYLARTEGMTPERFHRMIHKESGLLGLSGSSGDVRELLAREASDAHAADALSVFCHQTRKWIGAMAAALGGIDSLIFSGGIGENAAVLRARICTGLEFLGVRIDASENVKGAAVISDAQSRVAVRVIHTDEELYIARLVHRFLLGTNKRDTR